MLESQPTNNRVFISSTCHDLIDVRAELRQFILSLGLTPIMSDYLDNDFETVADANSIETCLVNLRTCDTVIIILSQRYGGDLSKAGFDKISATHLEYLEAVELKKKIIFFVRDRLLGDYEVFTKFSKPELLRWVKSKDIQIFEFLAHRMKLQNEKRDNWGWTFKDSIDIKERLKIDLRDKANRTRLDRLVESGSVPIMVCTSKVHRIPNSTQLNFHIELTNFGNSAAIDPAIMFATNTVNHRDAIEQVIKGNPTRLNILKSMKSNEVQYVDFQIDYPDIDLQERQNYFSYLLISYKSIYGDHLIDGTELNIFWNRGQQLGYVVSHFRVKELVGTDIYEKIIRLNK